MYKLDVKTESKEIEIRDQSGQVVASIDSDGDGSYDRVIAHVKVKKRPGRVKIKRAIKKDVKKSKKNAKKNKKKRININLTWNKTKFASGYEVQLSGSKYFLRPKSISTSKTKFSLNNLKESGYYIRVRAYTIYGKLCLNGSWSKIKHVK